jgi:hypothetical protein
MHEAFVTGHEILFSTPTGICLWNFRFIAKFPKVITHDKRLRDVSRELEYFFQSMLPLKNKTHCLYNYHHR